MMKGPVCGGIIDLEADGGEGGEEVLLGADQGKGPVGPTWVRLGPVAGAAQHARHLVGHFAASLGLG